MCSFKTATGGTCGTSLKWIIIEVVFDIVEVWFGIDNEVPSPNSTSCPSGVKTEAVVDVKVLGD